jgi:hypothetical protein
VVEVKIFLKKFIETYIFLKFIFYIITSKIFKNIKNIMILYYYIIVAINSIIQTAHLHFFFQKQLGQDAKT